METMILQYYLDMTKDKVSLFLSAGVRKEAAEEKKANRECTTERRAIPLKKEKRREVVVSYSRTEIISNFYTK
jgi:hypothetical protein